MMHSDHRHALAAIALLLVIYAGGAMAEGLAETGALGADMAAAVAFALGAAHLFALAYAFDVAYLLVAIVLDAAGTPPRFIEAGEHVPMAAAGMAIVATTTVPAPYAGAMYDVSVAFAVVGVGLTAASIAGVFDRLNDRLDGRLSVVGGGK